MGGYSGASKTEIGYPSKDVNSCMICKASVPPGWSKCLGCHNKERYKIMEGDDILVPSFPTCKHCGIKHSFEELCKTALRNKLHTESLRRMGFKSPWKGDKEEKPIEEMEKCLNDNCYKRFAKGSDRDGNTLIDIKHYNNVKGLCIGCANRGRDKFLKEERERGWGSSWFIWVWRAWGFRYIFNLYVNYFDKATYLYDKTVTLLKHKKDQLYKADQLGRFDSIAFAISIGICYCIQLPLGIIFGLVPGLLGLALYLGATIGVPIIILGSLIMLIGKLIITFGFGIFWLVPIFMVLCLAWAMTRKLPSSGGDESMGPYR